MRIIAIIIFSGIFTVSFSQKNITTGLLIGYNSSTFLGKDKPGKILHAMPGIYLGGTIQYALNNKLSVNADVALNTKGAKINTISSACEDLFLCYLDVPVMAKFSVLPNHYFPVYVSVGNSFAFNIVAFSTVGDLEKVKTVDLSALIEAGFNWKRVSLAVRYSYGYTKFDKSENHLDLRNSTISILAGFYFKR
jgi:hypothetical protein